MGSTYFAGPRVIFENRHDAGRQLAAELHEYIKRPVVVLAIPNGGVPIALELANALEADLDLVICRKISMPLNPGAGFGAVADDGTMILNEEAISKMGLNRQQINYEANRVRADIKQRSILYRGNRPLVSLSGKTVIIVDDGLASGYTMMAAVESVRHRRPKEMVVAVPVASATALDKLESIADKVVACATAHMPNYHISDFYRYWPDLSDDEVLGYLRHWQVRHFH
jgi:predicted phosphoribosyltransferase